MAFTKICKTADVQSGCGKGVEINGKNVAVFNLDGKYYAINEVCLHRGGPLSEGELDGSTVICPWHGWRFNVTTGENEIVPDMPTETYALKLEGDDILVDI